MPTDRVSFAQQLKSRWWLISYYVVMIVFSYLGSFDGINLIKSPWDQLLVAAVSVGIYTTGAGEPGWTDPSSTRTRRKRRR